MIKWVFIFYGIAFLLVGSMLFWGGFHNIDLSRNILKLAYVEGLDYESYSDRTVGGKLVTYDEGYRNGLGMSMLGFFQSIGGMMMLCYGLSRK